MCVCACACFSGNILKRGEELKVLLTQKEQEYGNAEGTSFIGEEQMEEGEKEEGGAGQGEGGFESGRASL